MSAVRGFLLFFAMLLTFGPPGALLIAYLEAPGRSAETYGAFVGMLLILSMILVPIGVVLFVIWIILAFWSSEGSRRWFP
jgi:hypothetical protein